jgi:hypothetical protein
MLSDINALEQFPRQIARGRRTDEISDRQSNHTRYPENHGIHLDALISGKYHLVVCLFDRYGSFAIGLGQRSVQPCPLHPDRDRLQRRIKLK